MLVSPHFKQLQCPHRNLSGFVSNTLLPPWLPEWPGPGKQPAFDLYYNKHQKQFTLPGEDRLVLFTMAVCVYINASRHATHWIRQASEQDSFFDGNKRYFIVFDDQIIDASKDKRIVNLFTRGSHHRNLSVIYVVQNLSNQHCSRLNIILRQQRQHSPLPLTPST